MYSRVMEKQRYAEWSAGQTGYSLHLSQRKDQTAHEYKNGLQTV